MSSRNDAYWRARDEYWRRVNAEHGDCQPPECPDKVDHTRYRISELAFADQAAELVAEVEEALTTGRMPRRLRPGDPGE